jgi:NitT/TauT family transport system substrate-binding protein
LKRIGVFLAISAVALGMVACGDDDDGGGGSGGGGGGDVTTIKFSQPLPKSLAFYPLWVGEKLGYFEEEGVEVELLPAGSDVSPARLVPSGQADVGSPPTNDVIVAASQDTGIKVFYEYYQKNVFSIVVPADSDIADIEGLEGKKIGVTTEAGSDAAVVRAALGEVNLDPDSDVELVVVGDGGPQVASALRDGDIDAFAGAIQDLVALRVAGVDLKEITPPGIADIPASSFIATPDVLEKIGPEKVGGFLRAWAKATYAGMQDPEKVLEMAKTEVPDEAQDPEFAKALLDISIELQTPVDGDKAFGTLRPEQWRTAQEQLRSAGELKRDVDIDALLDDQYLKMANDWDRAQVEKDIANYGG